MLGAALPRSGQGRALPGDLGGQRLPPVAHHGSVTRDHSPPVGRPRGASRDGDVRDRPGTQTLLPAWQFSFKRVAKPATVLALAPPDLFTPPPLQQLGPTGTGNSIEDSARADRSGTAITISFIGAPAGNGPCDARYTASAAANRRAVAFTIHTISPPSPPGTFCTAVGYTRKAILHLARPLPLTKQSADVRSSKSAAQLVLSE